MEIILLVSGLREVGSGSSSTRPSRPCRASSLKSHRRSATPIPRLRFWAAGSERGSPAKDELPCPTIEPGGPSRHAEASADQPRPGMPPDPTADRRTLTVLTRPAGHRRRVRIGRPGRVGDHRPYRVPICCRVDQLPRSSSASSRSSLANRLSVSLAVAPCSSAAKSRKSASSHAV